MNLSVKWIFILFFIPLSVFGEEETTCALSGEEFETIVSLPFKEFDQTAGSGWRPFYEEGCYSVASKLLIRYLTEHPEIAQQQFILPFHAGQLLAMAGDYEKALPFLEGGYTDIEMEYVNWNAFVDAHIAFITRDKKLLMESRDKISKQPGMPNEQGVPEWAIGKKMNLDVVDGFINCFNKPFAEAYENDCRNIQ